MSKGFTIIEVLVSSVIILIFAASFTLLVDTSLKYMNRSVKLTKAALASSSIIEEIKQTSYDDIFAYNNKKYDNGLGVILVNPLGSSIAQITAKHAYIEITTLKGRI